MENQAVWSYIIVCVLIAIVIAVGIIMRTKRFSGNKRVYKPAVLLKTEREYGEVKDPQGNIHKGVIKMTLTFGFRDGSTKSFAIDNKMRGKCQENDWGNLMYEGNKLLKFECKSGTIGTKLYVPDKNSVFHKFNTKK